MTGKVAVVVLVDVKPAARAWGFLHFLRCRAGLQRVDGLTFHKVLGSGHEGGFGLRPSLSRQGLFCVFRDDAAATAFLEEHPWVRAYREHARDFLTLRLRAFSSRGAWAGACPFDVATPAPTIGPVAALTRASIRPALAARFWRHSPPAERSLETAHGCLLATGLGEAPLLRQATFTLWESAAAMDAYARTGAHLEAIRAAGRGRFFSESMFSRFVPYDPRGSWKGRPLGQLLLGGATPAACVPELCEPIASW